MRCDDLFESEGFRDDRREPAGLQAIENVAFAVRKQLRIGRDFEEDIGSERQPFRERGKEGSVALRGARAKVSGARSCPA
jgi:hypothetical protein